MVKAADIDRTKWNSCVHFAFNGNIFGYQWYLNNVVKEWDGLVEGDYESVMPLIYKKGNFFSSSKLYTHELIRCSGLYSVHVLSEKRISSFIDAIPKEYKKWEIDLNEGVKPPATQKRITQETKENAVLYLGEDYDKITSSYSPTLRQQLERSNLAQLYTVNNIKPEVLADFYRKHNQGNWNETHYHTYLRLMYNSLHRGWGAITAVKNKNDEILAVNFFTISNQRVMRMVSAESESGRTIGALAFLYDQTIRFQSGKKVFLDFNVTQLSTFEKQFGAFASPFYRLRKR